MNISSDRHGTLGALWAMLIASFFHGTLGALAERVVEA